MAFRALRLKQGIQVAFVYVFLYGLLFVYVTWTMHRSCGPSIFTSTFSGMIMIYTCYSTINFWGEPTKFILLWIVLFLLSVSCFIFGVMSCLDSCTPHLMDNGSKTYQWVYQIYFPDIALMPWIFILGFTSMRYFFIHWRLRTLFFVFFSYNAFFIGIGIYIIGYHILQQNKEYELIWKLAIIVICIGALPCFIFIIYSMMHDCYLIIFTTDEDEWSDDDHEMEPFNPAQPFTIWIAIQIITSLLDLSSDILYVLLSQFYSPYLQIACWIFIFFQLIPDFFVLLQIVSDPDRYGDDIDEENEIIWFPIRHKYKKQSHVLERNILIVLNIIISTIIFITFGTLFILTKFITIKSVQNLLFRRNCFRIIQIPEEEDTKNADDLMMIDLRMHLIYLLFEVFFESIPFIAIILLNSYVLMEDMTLIAWASLGVSVYVVLRNIYMFFDDICLSRSQRKLYYCL
eukprot:183211_1